jgi:hypothetical protein
MEEIDVPVAGGDLRVLSWDGEGDGNGDGDAPTVLAAHGVTANALSWAVAYVWSPSTCGAAPGAPGSRARTAWPRTRPTWWP